jgi:hypothetical protein
MEERSIKKRGTKKRNFSNEVEMFRPIGKTISDHDLINNFVENYSSKKDDLVKEILFDLIDDGVLDSKRLRNYMIVLDYYKQLTLNNGHSTKAIVVLAESYGLTPRQVQNIMYKWSDKFRKR